MGSSQSNIPNNNYFDAEQTHIVVEEKKNFFSRKIDYSNPVLNLDRSPVIVNPSTNLCKVHYLFIVLGISTVFVVDKGVLLGLIKKNHLLGLNNNKTYAN